MFFKFPILARRIFSSCQDAQMEKYQAEVENMYLQMRTLRHDFKNHLQVMKAHLELGEYRELGEYIVSLSDALVEVEKLIETGNVRLDAILNSKISLARSLEIGVNVKVVLPPRLPVTDYDVCTLLGNLLDNAIEGCQTQREGEERFLRVYIGLLKEQLYISVSNSHATVMKKERGRYFSTKDPGRGLGIGSIDGIAARYNGYVNRQNDDSVFATEVLLPLEWEEGT